MYQAEYVLLFLVRFFGEREVGKTFITSFICT